MYESAFSLKNLLCFWSTHSSMNCWNILLRKLVVETVITDTRHHFIHFDCVDSMKMRCVISKMLKTFPLLMYATHQMIISTFSIYSIHQRSLFFDEIIWIVQIEMVAMNGKTWWNALACACACVFFSQQIQWEMALGNSAVHKNLKTNRH